jgi:uncharacterized protein YndB with AHSA1/START domain
MQGCKHVSFSQRRFVGFRKHFEFDSKRLLIANKVKVKILALKPNHLIKNTYDTTENRHSMPRSYFSNGPLLCCVNPDD